MKFFIKILLVFFLYCLGDSASADYSVEITKKAVCNVYGIFFLKNNGKTDTLISSQLGFFTNSTDSALLVTSFSLLKSADIIFAEYFFVDSTGKEIIKNEQIFPIETSKRYTWFDETRGIIIFKIPGIRPSGIINMSHSDIIANDEISVILSPEPFNVFKSKIKSILKDSYNYWAIPDKFENQVILNGSPVLNTNGEVYGFIESSTGINGTTYWIVPQQFINFIINDIITSSGLPVMEKQINNYTIDIYQYSNLLPYDSIRYKKLNLSL